MKKLHCYTARGKLREARYFLNQMYNPKIWNNDKSFEYCLNAFTSSADSVIAYVFSDFMFNTIKPRIFWQDWEKARKNKDKKKFLIDGHSEKKAIRVFLQYFDQEEQKILKKPISNYFHHRRNKIVHILPRPTQFGFATKEKGRKTVFIRRHLESTFLVDYKQSKGIKATFDMFDDRLITNNIQEKTLRKFDAIDVKSICKEYVSELDQFIKKFDKKNFFK
jgi:hypothetical protein